MNILILGGTTEARELATLLTAPRPTSPDISEISGGEIARPLRIGRLKQGSGRLKQDSTRGGGARAASHHVISSLAGRTGTPRLPPGEVRIGGFGGAAGLRDFLLARNIGVLVDATHPFAARISANAAAAAELAGVPLLVVRRPGWHAGAGDRWTRVPDLEKAAALLPRLGERVFLTTGRQGIAAFAAVDDCWFLARSVEPPEAPMPRRMRVLLDRGPFTLDGERRLLAEHRIDVLISKDSGGPDAKLVAARERGIPVILVDRPAVAISATTAGNAAEAAALISRGR